MRTVIETETGSKYTVREDEKGIWWVSANNIPSMFSVAVPAGEWEIDRPAPWPPVIGFRILLAAPKRLTHDDPLRMPQGGKVTSPIVKVEEVE